MAGGQMYRDMHRMHVSFGREADPPQASAWRKCFEPVLACTQVEWLQPYTDAKIRALGAAGVRSLLAVPISFVSEHIETLEEIDMEYRELALESGIQVRGCCLLYPSVVLDRGRGYEIVQRTATMCSKFVGRLGLPRL